MFNQPAIRINDFLMNCYHFWDCCRFSTVQQHLSRLTSQKNLTPQVPSEDQRTNQDSETRWATLPYINGISETLVRHLRSHIKVAHKPMATLRTTVVKGKDNIHLEAKAGVIYQFPCKGCNSKYVGETGKTLKARMKQPKVAVRNRYMSYLKTVHSLDTGHQFAFLIYPPTCI